HERFLHDQASRQRNAHLDGFDEGHAEGLAKGHAEGLTEGHAEGTTSAIRDVALNALRLGLTFEQVQAVTGLDPAEIARLAETLDT
ncbi:MAG: hypothetical protein FWF02_14550, partial [Micrococcales bacterium]|nr:hypothetical protein [Micrococcales bacterium]MCL2668898.1 hypothetical protein [Micrococcales bacterium]